MAGSVSIGEPSDGAIVCLSNFGEIMVACEPLRPIAERGGLARTPASPVFTGDEGTAFGDACGVASLECPFTASDGASEDLARRSRFVWSLGGRARRPPSTLGLLVRVCGSSFPSTASMAFCAICVRSMPAAASSVPTWSFISSSSSLVSE